MKAYRSFASLLLLVSFSFAPQAVNTFAGRASAEGTRAGSQADEKGMLEPSDFFEGFPQIKWGMSFQDAKKAIEKTGAHAARGFKDAETELVWVGKFNGMEGRGAFHFEEGQGLDEAVVGVYAYEKRPALFDEWAKKLAERHGAAKEQEDTSVDTYKLWRLKNGFTILLRTLKDTDSPVVEIRWVKD